jgi:hypothetical protein
MKLGFEFTEDSLKNDIERGLSAPQLSKKYLMCPRTIKKRAFEYFGQEYVDLLKKNGIANKQKAKKYASTWGTGNAYGLKGRG